MSINHYSSDLSQPQWWSHYMMDSSANASSQPNFISPASYNQMFCGRNGAAGFDLNNEDEEDEQAAAMEYSGEEEAAAEIPKERLFEKPLTPSDVGKLNRLVIPKQHAEKHFPLNGAGTAEPGENGLLLGFEDENGKSWRFRYSYWNSSQSYVLTKGWSRFVKEKRLDAGDVVVFARHRVEAGRFFIGWRRRNSDGGGSAQPAAMANGSGGGGWSRVFYPGQYPYPSQYNQAGPSASLPYQPESIHAGTVVQQNQTTSSSTTSGNSRKLRLFGVNLECHQADESSEPSTPVGSPMSSQGQAHNPYHHHHQYYSNNNNNHMDFSFSGGDVYRQG